MRDVSSHRRSASKCSVLSGHHNHFKNAETSENCQRGGTCAAPGVSYRGPPTSGTGFDGAARCPETLAFAKRSQAIKPTRKCTSRSWQRFQLVNWVCHRRTSSTALLQA